MLNIFSVLMRRRLQHIHRETAYYKVPKILVWRVLHVILLVRKLLLLIRVLQWPALPIELKSEVFETLTIGSSWNNMLLHSGICIRPALIVHYSELLALK